MSWQRIEYESVDKSKSQKKKKKKKNIQKFSHVTRVKSQFTENKRKEEKKKDPFNVDTNT